MICKSSKTWIQFTSWRINICIFLIPLKEDTIAGRNNETKEKTFTLAESARPKLMPDASHTYLEVDSGTRGSYDSNGGSALVSPHTCHGQHRNSP